MNVRICYDTTCPAFAGGVQLPHVHFPDEAAVLALAMNGQQVVDTAPVEPRGVPTRRFPIRVNVYDSADLNATKIFGDYTVKVEENGSAAVLTVVTPGDLRLITITLNLGNEIRRGATAVQHLHASDVAALLYVGQDIAGHLRRNGFTVDELPRQMVALGEEVGELLGAWRRYNGWARRSGTLGQVLEEWADVVITAFVTMAELARAEQLDLANVVEELNGKLHGIFTRGWRETESFASREERDEPSRDDVEDRDQQMIPGIDH